MASAAVFERNKNDLAKQTAEELLHAIIDWVFKDNPDTIPEIKKCMPPRSLKRRMR